MCLKIEIQGHGQVDRDIRSHDKNGKSHSIEGQKDEENYGEGVKNR